MSAAALKHSLHFRIYSKKNIVSSPFQKSKMLCESLHNSGLAVPSPYHLYIWLTIQDFFQSGGGTWLEFLWGGGTKLELRYWVRIVIINQIPPGGGTENLKSRNLYRKKVSCTTILQFTGRGHSTGITIPKASQSEICKNHGVWALNVWAEPEWLKGQLYSFT